MELRCRARVVCRTGDTDGPWLAPQFAWSRVAFRCVRSCADRTALPTDTRAIAMGDQAAVLRPRGIVQLRPLPLCGRNAFRAPRSGYLVGAWRRRGAGRTVDRDRDRSKRWLDDRDAS